MRTSHSRRRKNTVDGPGQVAEFRGMTDTCSSFDNLPLQLTSFVGRVRELTMVEELLAEHRLLTLTGPGGSDRPASPSRPPRRWRKISRTVSGLWNWLLCRILTSFPGGCLVLSVREAPHTPLADSLCLHLESREILLVVDDCERCCRWEPAPRSR